ncbi:hypothetical protein ACFFGH_17350 [Lysobacter korlensis]|uniref:Lipoprotein n=1 Tax=Lysobacter korlensis TaxID=553636 RepID=A0ABV6RS37_9GAMM
MKPFHVLIALALGASSGCGDGSDNQPLPTVDSEGRLTIPAGYKPGPDIELSRVDCEGYLAMTPIDIREEARRMCLQSTTDTERAANPYCKAHRVTEYCTPAK